VIGSVKVFVQNEAAQARREIMRRTREELKRAGAYVRGFARQSIGKGKLGKPSAPGSPPHSPKGLLKKSVIFGVEQDSVVIGPSSGVFGKLGASHEFGGVEPPKKAPRGGFRLVIGGHGPLRVLGPSGSRDRRGRFLNQKTRIGVGRLMTDAQVEKAREIAATIPPSQGGTLGVGKARNYPKRPFMGPALTRALPKLPALWAKSVNNG
jgi:phage gpG-like protein